MKKYPFVSVGIGRLVLMFIKAFSLHFKAKRRYKMIASRQVEIPFYGGISRQCGRGLGAPAQVIMKSAIPLLRKNNALTAKSVSAF